MKKSNIDPEDVVKDLTHALNLISQIENIDLNKVDLNKFAEDVEVIETNLKEKYKDVLKEAEDDLDSKK